MADNQNIVWDITAWVSTTDTLQAMQDKLGKGYTVKSFRVSSSQLSKMMRAGVIAITDVGEAHFKITFQGVEVVPLPKP
jgi:Tfp pilus assembly protein PilX